MNASPGKPVVLTRTELHQLVWKMPMMHLAKEYGISGNGLAKICVRLRLPYPARGHWAKVAAGSPPRTIPLPKIGPDTPASVEIKSTEAPSVRRGDKLLDALPLPLRRILTSVHVSARLAQPHPIVAKWLEDHERRRSQARRERNQWVRESMDPGELTADDRRRHRIADCLLKSLERCGSAVSTTDRGLLVADVDGSKVEFDLREKLKQIRRPLTQKEREWETWNTSGVK